jgi:hypothetical protein
MQDHDCRFPRLLAWTKNTSWVSVKVYRVLRTRSATLMTWVIGQHCKLRSHCCATMADENIVGTHCWEANNGIGSQCDNDHVSLNNDVGWQCNNDVHDTAWRTHVKYQYTPKSAPL